MSYILGEGTITFNDGDGTVKYIAGASDSALPFISKQKMVPVFLEYDETMTEVEKEDARKVLLRHAQNQLAGCYIWGLDDWTSTDESEEPDGTQEYCLNIGGKTARVFWPDPTKSWQVKVAEKAN